MTLDVALPPGDATALVGDVLEEFLTDCRLRNLSPRTVAWYRDSLRVALAPVIGVPLSTVTAAAVRESLASLMDGRAATTVNGFVRAVKSFLNWAANGEYLVQVDPRRIARLKEPKRIPPTLTAEQVQAILSVPDKRSFLGLRDHTCMALMLDTGVRVGEAQGLTPEDVSIPFVKVRGKGDKERTVALSAPMQTHLRKYLRAREAALTRARQETPFLFPSRTGRRLDRRSVQEAIKRYAQAAGIEGVRVSPHTFRYTYATHFLRNGGSIVSLQQVMGHTTLAMSRRYAAMVDEDAFEESMRCSPLAAVRGR
jgi:integrase/recombinase XerD